MSELAILNVGAGDTKLSFDKKNPKELERAKRIVQDMLKRGYALMVEVGRKGKEPIYQRAHGFDPETCEYIIMGGPDEKVDIGLGGNDRPRTGQSNPVDPAAPYGRKADGTPRKKPGRRERRLPADKTPAVAVGRVAGG